MEHEMNHDIERSLARVMRKLRRIKIAAIAVAGAAVFFALALFVVSREFSFNVTDSVQLNFRVEDVTFFGLDEPVPGFSFETWTTFHRVELSRELADDGTYDVEIAVVLGGQRQTWTPFGRLQDMLRRPPRWRHEHGLDYELMRFPGSCAWCSRGAMYEADFEPYTMARVQTVRIYFRPYDEFSNTWGALEDGGASVEDLQDLELLWQRN